MSIKNFFRLFFIVLFVALSFTAAFPQEKSDEGQVNIPWDEFIRLLELDKDEILLSWEEFQKILAQTGNKYIPSFQMKDEKVLLTREQFKKLLNQMRPPDSTVIQPPADYLITKAAYTGRITETDTSFTVVFDLEIFERQRSQYVKIPLFPRNVALRDIFLNGEKGIVVFENNRYTLATDRVGKHQITVHFSLKTDLKQGPRAVSIPIPMTPITTLLRISKWMSPMPSRSKYPAAATPPRSWLCFLRQTPLTSTGARVYLKPKKGRPKSMPTSSITSLS